MKATILSAERGESRIKQIVIDEVALSESERRVLKMLSTDDSVHIDQLISKSGLNLGELMSALLQLEMTDRIRQLPGKSFVRRM
jgi:DNA processing protein